MTQTDFDENCPFCNENLLWDSCHVVLRNDLCKAIVSEMSAIPNALMIVPIAHRRTTFELTLDEFSAHHELVLQAKAIIDRACSPEGYSIGWNCEKVGGQEVMHCHLHVVPRFLEEKYSGQGIRHWFKDPENRRKLPPRARTLLSSLVF